MDLNSIRKRQRQYLQGDEDNNTDYKEEDVQDEDTEDAEVDAAKLFGFQRFFSSPFIKRHTIPWLGRDDDPKKIEEICADLKRMVDLGNNYAILGVDQKIGACHLKLEKSSTACKRLIREIPALHLTKHRIVNVCSAYKEAGLLHLLMFMKDDEKHDEWARLLTIQNIRTAARLIRRLALALHLAFQIAFVQHLGDDDALEFIEDVQSLQPNDLATKWHTPFTRFLEHGRKNATFALHYDMLKHTSTVAGIQFAERIGGPQGYDLLRACAKSSLLFAYTNGASSYASYTTHLLHDHEAAPPFYQGLKKDYFAVPYEGSAANYALDTIREEDHRRVKKFFRPGASAEAITGHLKGLNEAEQMLKTRAECLGESEKTPDHDEHIQWPITNVDMQYIKRGALLIIRRGALSDEECSTVYNMYTRDPTPLSDALLDGNTNSCGKYLLLRYCHEAKLFGISTETLNDEKSKLQGPTDLRLKVINGKSTTVNRAKCRITANVSPEEVDQTKRKKKLVEQKKRLDRYYSTQNTCQALVKADCSKYKVTKALTMPRGIIALIGLCMEQKESGSTKEVTIQKLQAIKPADTASLEKQLDAKGVIMLRKKHVPQDARQAITVATCENAGIPFKAGKVCSGQEYIQQTEDRWIKDSLILFPNLHTLTMSEEKYTFTPDTFKQQTRQQRVTSSDHSIAHLREGSEIISDARFAKLSATTTSSGKMLMSTYLPSCAHRLSIKQDLNIIFDSELHMEGCSCSNSVCMCEKYTVPLQCKFDSTGLKSKKRLETVKQRKGEAEMAVVDWLLHLQPVLRDNEATVSVISSGDIDAVVIHIFALSLFWPRDQNGRFLHKAYVQLCKRAYFDLYDITTIIELLEEAFQEPFIGVKLAICLCAGGNDFIPKFYGISHLTMLKVLFGRDKMRQGLLNLTTDGNDKVISQLRMFRQVSTRNLGLCIKCTGGLLMGS